MGALMRAKNWARTPLGPPESWPQSLKTVVRLILLSRYPMFVWWGKDLINLYNDRYVPMLGKKHPASLGKSGRESWSEIWDQIGPRAEAVLQRGEATFDRDLLLMMDRHGYLEETYFTFSYSPFPNDEGKIGGLFCVVTEDTDRVISERRMRLLRNAASATVGARTTEAVCNRAAGCLEEARKDLPFALIYLRAESGKTLRLACASGISPSHAASPATLDAEKNSPWPAAEVVSTLSPVLVDDLSSRFKELPMGAWDISPNRALLVPLAQQGQTEPAGVLIAGINPHRELDDDFRGFVELVAGQISAALANANVYLAERKRAEALAELDRAKTAFFSNVSHEFRTPLTLMLGPTEDALNSSARSLSGAELERVHRNELRLLKLVNTLLDFSRLESGRIKARYRPTDLSALTAELAGVFRSAIERAGLTLSVEAPQLPKPLYVDREMWEKIVLNLLSNALQSTFDGGISVVLHDAGDHAEISIHDTGTGISAEELPHLFERFRRIENARRRTHEGSGIGLALVHELVRMHGGRIDVKSALNHGATFTVSIPYGSSHLPADAVDAEDSPQLPGLARNAFVQEALSWLPAENPLDEDLLDRENVLPRDLAGDDSDDLLLSELTAQEGGRVLLVDDNRDMREYVEHLLRGRFEVITAENGRIAFEKALEYPPDIVVSDVMMPEMDGFQLLSALREDPATATVPVVLLSARAGEESRVEGMEAGADDYLIKPFGARELLARVRAHIRIARFRKQAIQREMQLESELVDARRLAAEAVEHITDSFFAIDFEWRFTYMNPSAYKLAREAAGIRDLLGTTVWEAYPALAESAFAEQYRRCMELRVPVQFEAPFRHRWYSVRAYPAPAGMAVYAVDITTRKSIENELRRKQEHLLLTQKSARIGTWEFDVETESLIISPEFAEMAGLPPHVSRLRYADFLSSLFVSGDRKKTDDALQMALRRKKEFSLELRLKRTDGAVRLVSIRGKAFYNQGKPIVLGVVVDITSAEARPVKRSRVKRKKSRLKKAA